MGTRGRGCGHGWGRSGYGASPPDRHIRRLAPFRSNRKLNMSLLQLQRELGQQFDAVICDEVIIFDAHSRA